MRRFILVVLSMVLLLSSSTVCFSAAGVTPAEQKILSVIDNSKATMVDIENKIYEFNELGFQEFKSSSLLMDMFEKEGFKVQRGLVGKDVVNGGVDKDIPTGFIATYEGKGKGVTVALLPEYDALPNGHACGHNLISGSCYAAAMGIKEYLKNAPGTLKVIGCPAEEIEAVKQYYADAGLYEGIDVAYSPHGGHEWSTVLNGKCIVSTQRLGEGAKGLQFKGKPSHVNGSPWVGRSALDAVMLTSMGLEFMREHSYDTDRIHYIVTSGGAVANIVPENAAIDVWLRTDDTNHLFEMMKRAEKVFEGAALMTETTFEYKWGTQVLSPVPVPTLATQAADAGVALGVPRESFNMNPRRFTTDAGNTGYAIPLSFIMFPMHPTKPVVGHSDEFAVLSNTDYAKDTSLLVGKIMALSAVRLMSNEADVKTIKDEFAAYFKAK